MPQPEGNSLLSKVSFTIVNKKTGEVSELPWTDPRFWFFVGLWLADGSTYNSVIEVSLDPEQAEILKELIRQLFGREVKRHKDKRTSEYVGIRLYYKPLARWLRSTFGVGALRKRIPFSLLSLPIQCLEALVNGFLAGDGHKPVTNSGSRCNIISLSNGQLACFIYLALLKLGRLPSVKIYRKWKGRYGESRVYRIYWNQRSVGEMRNAVGKFLNPSRNVVIPIRTMEIHEYHGKVVDIDVEEEDSFVVPYATVHNDNVGDLNEMWVELKEICKELNLNTWREFEEYITSTDKLDKKLIDWVKRGLTWKATDFGIETRETCKWIIFHHRELLEDPKIKKGIENPPKLTKEDEVESYVRRMYFQVLGRHPDRGGLEYYKKAILEGKLSKEALPLALKTSPEYAEKFGQPERVRMQIPVNVDIGVTTDTFIEAMRRSGTFWKKIKPAIDIGRFVMDMLDNHWKDFERWFYQNRDKITLTDFVKKLKEMKEE